MPDEIEACEGHLFKPIVLVQPKVIATLGNFVTNLLSGSKRGSRDCRRKQCQLS